MKRISFFAAATWIGALVSAGAFAGAPTLDNNIVDWGTSNVTWVNPAAWARAELEPDGIDPAGSYLDGIDFNPYNSSNVGLTFDDEWMKPDWDTSEDIEYIDGSTVPWETGGQLPIGYGVIDATESPNGVLFQQTGVEGLATDMLSPDSGERYASYLRMPFDGTGAGSGPYIFEALVDDGAAVYLNGEEWFKINCCNDQEGEEHVDTPPNYTSVAFNSSNTETQLVQVVVSSIPRRSDNLLAVSLHSNNNTSSDQGFDFRIYTPGNYRPWGVNESGNWSTASNWEIDTAGANEFAIFGDAVTGSKTVYTDSSVTLDGVQFEGGGSYNIAGTGEIKLAGRSGQDASLNVVEGSHEFQVAVSLSKNLDADVASGASIDFNNELNLNGRTLRKTGDGDLVIGNNETSGDGTVNVMGGAVVGGGTVGGDVQVNGGSIAPGGVVDSAPGSSVLTIIGDATVNTGELVLNVYGNGDSDAIAGGENGTLTFAPGATVTVNLNDGYTPQSGHSIDAFPGWSSISGSATLPAGWQIDATTGKLTFGDGPPPAGDCDVNNDNACDVLDINSLIDSGADEATIDQWLSDAGTELGLGGPVLRGDSNLDGTVNATDLNAVGQNWLETGKTWESGDFNGDDTTNAQDLNAVGQNWLKTSAAPAATAAVPEPSSLGLLIFALIGGLRFRQRSR